jgi:hypothetical protein
MKSATINLMLATAALLVASTVASAEDMKVDIPFAFQAGGNVMAPGAYMVYGAPNEWHFMLVNVQSHEKVFLLSGALTDPPQHWRTAGGGMLQFECGDTGCALKRLWTGHAYPAQEFSTPKAQKGYYTRLAVVRAAVGNAK